MRKKMCFFLKKKNYFEKQLIILLGVLPENFCGENEFQCAGGFCIMDYKRCNGIVDCPSGNDEDGCPPQVTDFPGRFSDFDLIVWDRTISFFLQGSKST